MVSVSNTKIHLHVHPILTIHRNRNHNSKNKLRTAQHNIWFPEHHQEWTDRRKPWAPKDVAKSKNLYVFRKKTYRKNYKEIYIYVCTDMYIFFLGKLPLYPGISWIIHPFLIILSLNFSESLKTQSKVLKKNSSRCTILASFLPIGLCRVGLTNTCTKGSFVEALRPASIGIPKLFLPTLYIF